ncbi:hydantoinase/oxoprolinase family protein [Neobacillus cucumis]|uniref:hydantoinase/oxoprolinase N-terminal domain-containing protein n=1 Tax=Neobacillus cucumis TaxID=1740721 RepID=UPI0018DF5801|nr:hydantoinase/oxoprolinase family protein [Neobacillus cucumis]MBI0579481.1 hydantoinase/oxoprolinase family protein [Neobacillus cucumis]
MVSQIRMGFDVGGTFTDGVIMQGREVIAKTKSLNTEDVTTGIVKALDNLLKDSKIDPSDIQMISLCTTHTINAIIERKNLDKVGVLRLGAPSSTSIPPLTGWPEDLVEAIGGKVHTHIIAGGSEFDGRDIMPLDEEAIVEAVKKMTGNVTSVAIVGIFSPILSRHEERAAEIVREYLGDDVSITLSHKIASLSLIERENSTILNASVVSVMRNAVNAFKEALSVRGIHAKLFAVQNDGSVMNADFAVDYPIFTVSAGPAASVRGAVYLSGIENGAVVDVGGTSTDVAYIVNGFPRESSVTVNIGGVDTNIRCPDLLSIALGGGTIIEKNIDETVTVGPKSVGYKLTEQGISFGGTTLTVHDVAVATGRLTNNLDIFETEFVTHGENISRVPKETILKADRIIKEKIEVAVDQMKTKSGSIPTIFIGGGAVTVPQKNIHGTSEIIIPDNFEVGGAVGSTIAEISGSSEIAVDLETESRGAAIERAVELAKNHVREAGAVPGTEEILEIEEVPFTYMPGKKQRIRVRVKGNVF